MAFFTRTVADLYGFKDDVRNIVMHAHARGTYDAAGSASVVNRVEEFFRCLTACKLQEGGSVDLLDPSHWK